MEVAERELVGGAVEGIFEFSSHLGETVKHHDASRAAVPGKGVWGERVVYLLMSKRTWLCTQVRCKLVVVLEGKACMH